MCARELNGIGITHYLANFLILVYDKIKKEVLFALVTQADETTHKMLEGDEVYNWYLWGFFSPIACYFETHNTRPGDVVYNILKDSHAQFLVSDGYTGYNKAINNIRKDFGRIIVLVDCNAHAYRYFEEAGITWKSEAEKYLALYGEIYKLEEERKEKKDDLSPLEQLHLRKQMRPLFEKIKKYCEEELKTVMPSSGLEKAVNYFLNHYEGLTLCTTNIDIPLDNNLSEREIRPPVVGRKTWYGTHSKRGAKTTAILFSIVQSCKINNINPRNYLPWIVEQIHKGKPILTPYEYSQIKETQ